VIHHFVHFDKASFKRVFILFLLVLRKLSQNINELLLDELGNLLATMPINTPKIASPFGNYKLAIWASSWFLRQPCIEHAE